MSNVPTPQPMPSPLKTEKMDAIDLWEVYAASPPIARPPSVPPPLPPRAWNTRPMTMPMAALPKEPSRTHAFGRAVGTQAIRARALGAKIAVALGPKIRAATAPRFSLLTLVIVLIAAWGGAYAAGRGVRAANASVTPAPALQAAAQPAR